MANPQAGSAQFPKFETMIFGKDGEYKATRQGNTVLIQGKDGSVRKTDIDTFMKCLAAALPKMKTQPQQDGFIKNMTTLQTVNPNDDALTKINKVIHNAGAVQLNPFNVQSYVKDKLSGTGKYA